MAKNSPLYTIVILGVVIAGLYIAWKYFGLSTLINNALNPAQTPSTSQGATAPDASTQSTPQTPASNPTSNNSVTAPTVQTITPQQSNPLSSATNPTQPNTNPASIIAQNSNLPAPTQNVVSNPQEPTQTLQQLENPVYNPNTPAEISPAPKTGVLTGSGIAMLFNGTPIAQPVIESPTTPAPAPVSSAELSAVENQTYDLSNAAVIPTKKTSTTSIFDSSVSL